MIRLVVHLISYDCSPPRALIIVKDVISFLQMKFQALMKKEDLIIFRRERDEPFPRRHGESRDVVNGT